jgi:hypothetical protein
MNLPFGFFKFILVLFLSTSCLAEDREAERNVKDLLKEVNEIIEGLGGDSLNERQLITGILEGLRRLGAPSEFKNSKKIAAYIKKLAADGVLSIETKAGRVECDGVYVYDVDLDTEFKVKGPRYWEIFVRIYHDKDADAGFKNWIEVPIEMIVHEQ